MRIWFPLAGGLLLVAALLWTPRGRTPGTRAPRATEPSVAPPCLPGASVAPSPACSRPLTLDSQIVLHLVPLPDARTGCRIEFRTKENPFTGDEVLGGDVITEVGREQMSTRAALGLVHRLEQAGETGIALTVLRNGETLRVVARVTR